MVDGGGLDPLERRVESRQRLPRISEMLVRVVERAAVVGAQNEEAHHLGCELLQHLAHGEEVAEGLRHLLVVDADEPVVHPVVHEGVVVRALGLGDLVLVVRELQILAAAVDVEVLAEQFLAHRGTLDMPAGPARSPWATAIAARRASRAFHSTKSSGSLLRFADFDALTGAQVVERLAGKLAVAGEVANRVVHVAVRARIGEPLVDRACGSSAACAARNRWRAARSRAARRPARRCLRASRRRSARVSASMDSPFSAARLMILSSMSVMLRT